MPKSRSKEWIIYRSMDWLMAAFAWLLFFVYRKRMEQPTVEMSEILDDGNLWLGLFIIPLAWLLLYFVFENTGDIYRFSRLATFKQTLIISLAGCLIIFFTIMLDDTSWMYKSYLQPFLRLFLVHFLLTVTSRMIFLSWIKSKVKNSKVRYNTLIIGGDENAMTLYQDIMKEPAQMGHNFVGFVHSNGVSSTMLSQHLPSLGNIANLSEVLKDHHVEEVIIAVESSDHKKINGLLNALYPFKDRVAVKIIPDMYDIMIGTVKMNHVYGAVLIHVDQELMPRHERIFKRLIDIIASVMLLIILLPLYLFIAYKVWRSSEGPLFFKQERVGKDNKAFDIYKFRSMFVNAEENGPQLSYDTDPRITSWGRIMRKFRLDELPQFYNVLRGDMSLVGPRPERQFFIDQIVEQEPLYMHLLKVRPGITSWGQVKFGYASNVQQMLQRMKFDLIYIENMSLGLDLKILVYTVLILIQGKGK